MKGVVTGMLAGQHSSSVALGYKAPVDGLLGETMRLVKANGTQLAFETISVN